MTHFLDVSHDVAKGDLDVDNLKGMFKNKAWGDLPVIMKLRGHPKFDYKTQHFIQEQSNGNYTVINHIFLTKQRLPQSKLQAFATGKCYEIAWGRVTRLWSGKLCSGCWSRLVDCNSDICHFQLRRRGPWHHLLWAQHLPRMTRMQDGTLSWNMGSAIEVS